MREQPESISMSAGVPIHVRQAMDAIRPMLGSGGRHASAGRVRLSLSLVDNGS